MDLFCLIPSPGSRTPMSVAIDAETRLEVVAAPDTLDDTWMADLGRFRSAELADANWVAAVVRPLPHGGDPGRLSGAHDEVGQRVFRALRLAGMPGNRAGLRLAGTREPGRWKTLRLSTVRARTRKACHAATPWDGGTFTATVAKVAARLDALHDPDGHTRVQTHERLRRCLRTAEVGMQMDDPYERFPAFTRVLEGLVTVGSRNGPQQTLRERVQFVARSGVPAAEIVRDIYRIRNKILHMDTWRDGLPTVPFANREQVARARYASAEVLACQLLYEILSSDDLFRHFESDGTIAAFWEALENAAIPNPWPVLADWDAAELLEWSSDPAVPPIRCAP